MNKQIFILNGAAGAGKDTFASILNTLVPTLHISSVEVIKKAAKELGWDGAKTAKSRAFLCDLKKFVNDKSDYVWKWLDDKVSEFKNDNKYQILLIDIREPDEIKKAVERYGCKTILIQNKNVGIKYDNQADINVFNYEYDYCIKNNGSIDEFYDKIYNFRNFLLLNQPSVKVVAVDFDNTIAKTRYPEIIEPIPEVVNLLRGLKERGATIILWTCREGKILEQALVWCKQNNVPIDLVNENDKSRIEYWGNDCRKIGADLYIDDKSFSLNYDRRDKQDILDLFSGL